MNVVLGLIAGLLGFLPLAYALKAARNVTSTSNFSYASILILAVVGSTVILFGAVAVCIALNRDGLVPFAGGEAAGIIVSAIVFGIYKVLLRK